MILFQKFDGSDNDRLTRITERQIADIGLSVVRTSYGGPGPLTPGPFLLDPNRSEL